MVPYILQDPGGRFYVGVTSDLPCGLRQHSDPDMNPSRWTRHRGPWKMVFSQEFSSSGDALRAERFVKKMKSSAFIKKLIAGERTLPLR